MKGITMAKSMGKKGTICGPNIRWVNCNIYRAQVGYGNVRWLFSRDTIFYPLTYEFSSNVWIKSLYNTYATRIDRTKFG